MAQARMFSGLAAILVGVYFSSSLAQPQWLKQAAAQAASVSPAADASAIILHHAASVTVSSVVKTQIHLQKAVKILKPSAEIYGTLMEALAPFREIKNLKGWVLLPEGGIRNLAHEKTMQFSASGTDDNQMFVAALDGVKSGAIVAFEYDIFEIGVTSSYQTFVLQEQEPVKFVQFSVLVPQGWALHKAEWQLAPLQFEQAGDRYIWTGRDLPFRAEEPLMPSWHYLARRIAITAYDTSRIGGEHFRDWSAVANWCADIHEPAVASDASVKILAQQITQAARTPQEKLNRIAEFVRDDIRYVAVEIGKGRWQPRRAGQTLYNRYGDCKDKTTLMRALLQAVDIPSAPVLANSDYAVRPSLPTPFQFNHCIVGIPLQGVTEIAALPNATAQGWLFFDPTDPASRLGDLPTALQGDWVLLATPAKKDSLLLRLPYRMAENYRRSHRAEARLAANGEITAAIKIVDYGDRALASRYQRSITPPEEQIKAWRKFFSPAMPNVELSHYETGAEEDSAWVSFQLRSTDYLKSAGAFHLLKVNLFQATAPTILSAEKREQPIWFGPAAHEEFELTWTLPGDWKIEEAPAPLATQCAVAELHSRTIVKGDTIRFYARQQSNGRLLPVEEYAAARKFSASQSATAKATVFLKK